MSSDKPQISNKTVSERIARFRIGSLWASWMVSLLTHVAGIFTLAWLIVLPSQDQQQLVAVSASMISLEEEMVFHLSEESGAMGDPKEPSERFAEAAALVSSELNLGEMIELQPEAGVLTAASTMSSTLDALMAADGGNGGGRNGMGVGMTSVFGVKTVGKRFIYVVDNSNSMSKGRLEAAIQEVQDSVEMLSPNQFFYVIFYSDTAYPLFHPKPSKGYVTATPENKKKLQQWMTTVEHCLQTRGEKAMELALSLRPDVIYLMGDGAFTDRTVQKTLERDDPKLLIHAFGFDMKSSKDKEGFERIAKKFRGDFHDATVAKGFLIAERENNRPHNRYRHGSWGITLPLPEKSKD